MNVVWVVEERYGRNWHLCSIYDNQADADAKADSLRRAYCDDYDSPEFRVTRWRVQGD
jgi:hypothetical protein